jgi:hypothetical protein
MNKLLVAALVATGLMSQAGAQPTLQLTPGMRPAASGASIEASAPLEEKAPPQNAAPIAITPSPTPSDVSEPSQSLSTVAAAPAPVITPPVVKPAPRPIERHDEAVPVASTVRATADGVAAGTQPTPANRGPSKTPETRPVPQVSGSPTVTANPPAAPAPVAQQPGAERIVSPVTRGSESVNPFTGKALNAEQAQRQLELLRMQTQLLEEQLKQVGLTEDMKNVPLRKSVEAAASTTALRKEAVQQHQLQQAVAEAERAYAQEQAAAKEALRAARNQKKAEQTAAKAPKAEPAVQAPAPVRLVSVVSVGGQRSAVLAVGDATLIVRDGERTANGVVEVVDETTVRVGSRSLHVESMTLSRAVLPDRVASQESVTPSPATTPAPTAASATLPPVLPPPTATGPGSMPALQLPPGVRLLPR